MNTKEAIEIIKKNCTEGSQLREACSMFIPELKESEDERIRKRIILRLQYDLEQNPNKFTKKEIPEEIAYLERQKEQKPAENISQLTVQGKGVYKICPRCKERMIRDDSKVYTSIPPQYGYNCPKCGTIEFDTVMYDSPEKEEKKPIEDVIKNITKNKEAATNFLKSAGIMDDNGELAEMYRSEQQPVEWSEDERIRKSIVSIINQFARMCEKEGDPCEASLIDNALAYLEKQREPLPVPDKFSGLKSLMLQYLQSAAIRNDDTEIESDTDLFGRKILDYVWKHDKNQKEQKHSLNFDAISSWLRDHASRYVNSEFNEFHHCVEYDGTFDTERLVADLKAAVDNGTFDVDAAKESDKAQLAIKLIDKYIDENTANAHEMDDSNPEKEYYRGVDDTLSNIAGILNSAYSEEKQKEQKPAMIQWTGKNLKEVINFTGKSPRFGEWFKSWDDFENYVHAHNDILKLFCEDGSHYEVPVGAWIVKTPDGFNIPSLFRFVQKPAEWSEEDEKIRQSIIKDIEFDRNYTLATTGNVIGKYNEQINWLKILAERFNLQPKQEWSEVDKDYYDAIIAKLEVTQDDAMLTDNQMDFLKSLRPWPHWKPSEEQVKAIDLAIKFVTDDFDEHPTLSETLRGLYNELKKL